MNTTSVIQKEDISYSGNCRPQLLDPRGSFFVLGDKEYGQINQTSDEHFLQAYRKAKKENDPYLYVESFKALARSINTYIHRIQNPPLQSQKEYKDKILNVLTLVKKMKASLAMEEQKLLVVENSPKKVRKKSLQHYRGYTKTDRQELIGVFELTKLYIGELKDKMSSILSTTHVKKEQKENLPNVITFHKENITHLFFENTLLHNVYRSILNKEDLQKKVLELLPSLNLSTRTFASVPGHTEFFYSKTVQDLESVHSVIQDLLLDVKETQPKNYKHCLAVFLETQLQFETEVANALKKFTGVPILDLNHTQEHDLTLNLVEVEGKFKKGEQLYACPLSGIKGVLSDFNIHHKGKRSHQFFSDKENLVGLHMGIHTAIHYITHPLGKLDDEIKKLTVNIAQLHAVEAEYRPPSYEKDVHNLIDQLQEKHHTYNKYYVGLLLLSQEQLDKRFEKVKGDYLSKFYEKHGKNFRKILDNYIQVHLANCIPKTLLRNIRLANSKKEEEYQLRSLTPSKLPPDIFVEKAEERWSISPLVISP